METKTERVVQRIEFNNNNNSNTQVFTILKGIVLVLLLLLLVVVVELQNEVVIVRRKTGMRWTITTMMVVMVVWIRFNFPPLSYCGIPVFLFLFCTKNNYCDCCGAFPPQKLLLLFFSFVFIRIYPYLSISIRLFIVVTYRIFAPLFTCRSDLVCRRPLPPTGPATPKLSLLGHFIYKIS